MGDPEAVRPVDCRRRSEFLSALLRDLDALELMLADGHFETGVRRVGAEQEMVLVDPAMRPAPVALDVLDDAADRRLTTELARFDLEANLSPQPLAGAGLQRLEDELYDVLRGAGDAAADSGAQGLLTGILPTLRRRDL